VPSFGRLLLERLEVAGVEEEISMSPLDHGHWWRCSLRGGSWIHGCWVCWTMRFLLVASVAALVSL
jgi:hypothetical protein